MSACAGPARPTSSGRLLLLGAVALVGLNLRPFLTAVGPLTDRIVADLGLDYPTMSWLTVLPIMIIGVVAFLTPLLRRASARRVVLWSLGGIAAGSLLRGAVDGAAGLMATAVLTGLGVACIQAVFPGLIKSLFPGRTAQVTGLYTAAMMGGGALGAQLSAGLSEAFGDWRPALALLGLLAIPAMAAVRRAMPALPAPEASRVIPFGALLARPRTWLLMACFGLVNAGYSALVAWLAPFYQALGWSQADAGGLIALMAVGQAAAALGLPVLAARRADWRAWIALTMLCQAVGFASFVIAPELAPRLMALVIGAGLGGCFALTMGVSLAHLPNPEDAGALTALMQGGGFLIAAAAPWIDAVLHQADGFAAVWLAHIGTVAIALALSLRLSPRSYRLASP